MRKLLILISIFASFFLAACSSDPVVNRLPWVYRIDIQQGNVIDQDGVNQIRTGMSKRQVQFVLGAPMLIDPFHADRWDYVYLFKPGSQSDQEAAQHNISLFFDEKDRLVRIAGNLQPDYDPDAPPRKRHVTVDVPPQERVDPGVLTRLWRWMGFGKNE
jgi:outer membrane protein assembly factor BamE